MRKAPKKPLRQSGRIVQTVEAFNKAHTEYWQTIKALIQELEEGIEGLENHARGFNRRDTFKKIEGIIFFLDALGVHFLNDPLLLSLIERAKKLRATKPGRGGKPDAAPKEHKRRAQVCGLLRALADVKPRGTRNECWASMRAVAFPESVADVEKDPPIKVLRTADGKKWRAYYKAIFENAFPRKEVAELDFPKNADEYDALFQHVLDRVRSWSQKNPDEFLKIFYACFR